jgi:hypothetical protein
MTGFGSGANNIPCITGMARYTTRSKSPGIAIIVGTAKTATHIFFFVIFLFLFSS